MQEIERVLALGSDALSPEQRAFALAWHARGVAALTGLATAQEPARDALEAARAAGTPHPEAIALMLLGTGLAAQGQGAEGLAHLEAALGIAEEERDVDLLTWAYHDLLAVLITARRDDEAQALSERALA